MSQNKRKNNTLKLKNKLNNKLNNYKPHICIIKYLINILIS